MESIFFDLPLENDIDRHKPGLRLQHRISRVSSRSSSSRTSLKAISALIIARLREVQQAIRELDDPAGVFEDQLGHLLVFGGAMPFSTVISSSPMIVAIGVRSS